MVMDERSEVSFLIPRRSCRGPRQPIFVGLSASSSIHTTGFACHSVDEGVRQEVQCCAGRRRRYGRTDGRTDMAIALTLRTVNIPTFHTLCRNVRTSYNGLGDPSNCGVQIQFC